MTRVLQGDSLDARKQRGAFFTPRPIADHLAEWAIGANPQSKILDPSCGEGVFLQAAGAELRKLGRHPEVLDEQLFGIDLHGSSLAQASGELEHEGLDAHFIESDFFAVSTPEMLGAKLPYMDAVIGNPPYVRYQEHAGESRRLSVLAALRQGVRLNGLASSWAASLVHAAGFLKPDGRLAMVLPQELLTVGYAEPVRAWMQQRFESVNLIMFERLQFDDALEKVVLVLAEGSGGCDSFSLHCLESANDLARSRPYSHRNIRPGDDGKWTDALIPRRRLNLFRDVSSNHFTPLSQYGSSELGIVTGANSFFTLSEQTRLEFGLETHQLLRVCPPGTKHLKSLSFSHQQWASLRDCGERVWLFRPDPDDDSLPRRRYSALGLAAKVDTAYKCSIRSPWWRPPTVTPPDLFFTYMSHRYPRLIANSARTVFVNSMHGVRLRPGAPAGTAGALPLLCLNSVTMLGAELFGRSYGGGVLKMEPREAAALPLPGPEAMSVAWEELRPLKTRLERLLKAGQWTEVVKRVDAAVLGTAAGLRPTETSELLEAARGLRARRTGRAE